MKGLLADPDFLNQVLVGQYDLSQYDESIEELYINNSCHVTVLHICFRIMQLFRNGYVDETTIGDRVRVLLESEYHTASGAHPFIEPSHGQMYAVGLAQAFTLFDPDHQLLQVVTDESLFLTTPDEPVTSEKLLKMQDMLPFMTSVFEQGGVVVALGLKYGVPGASGHFAIVTNFEETTDTEPPTVHATIVDPMFQGSVVMDANWQEFWQNSLDGRAESEERPIMSMFGVVPS